MPNIFPPIDLQRPVVGAQVTPDDQVPVPGVLGSVAAPSGASVALNGADNDLQAAKDKVASDTPKKYDYSAHGVLGNIGHVLARSANIAGDILDPAATSLIPNSDLYNAHKRAGDIEEVDKANAKQLAAQKESDAVDNENAQRTQQQGQFDAEAPGRDARTAEAQASTAKTEQETKPLSSSDAETLNHLYNSKGFSAGMTPEETTRLTEAHKTIAEMKARQAEFTQRQQQQAQNHSDTEKDRALSRDIAAQNHEDTMGHQDQAAGRKVLDKAEGSYRTASQSADELQEMVDGIKTGNKIYAKALPLEGALAVNTSQGVKRINRTEVEQIAGAGSLLDKIQGELGKLKSGDSIPPNVLPDYEKLAKMLKQGAYSNYRGAFDSAKQRYKLDNEEALPGPNGEGAAGTPPAGAKVRDYTQVGR